MNNVVRVLIESELFKEELGKLKTNTLEFKNILELQKILDEVILSTLTKGKVEGKLSMEVYCDVCDTKYLNESISKDVKEEVLNQKELFLKERSLEVCKECKTDQIILNIS